MKKDIRYLTADLHNRLMGGGVGWILQIAKLVFLTKLWVPLQKANTDAFQISVLI